MVGQFWVWGDFWFYFLYKSHVGRINAKTHEMETSYPSVQILCGFCGKVVIMIKATVHRVGSENVKESLLFRIIAKECLCNLMQDQEKCLKFYHHV